MNGGDWSDIRLFLSGWCANANWSGRTESVEEAEEAEQDIAALMTQAH